jgi:hypothetical protein
LGKEIFVTDRALLIGNLLDNLLIHKFGEPRGEEILRYAQVIFKFAEASCSAKEIP